MVLLAKLQRAGSVMVDHTLPALMTQPLRFRVALDQVVLDDPSFWYEVGVEIQQPDGTWRFDESFVTQCGGNKSKDGTATQPMGFDFPVQYAGRRLRITFRLVTPMQDAVGRLVSVQADPRPCRIGFQVI
jgi:hypothetical protein